MIWKEGGVYLIDGEPEEAVVGFRHLDESSLSQGCVDEIQRCFGDDGGCVKGPPDRVIKKGGPELFEDEALCPLPQEEIIKAEPEERADTGGDPLLEEGSNKNTVMISEKEYELFKWMKFYFANQKYKQDYFTKQEYHAKRMGDARYEIGRILKSLGAFDDPESDLKEPR